MNGTLATSEVTIRQEPIQYRGPFEGIFNGMVLNAGWPVSTRTDIGVIVAAAAPALRVTCDARSRKMKKKEEKR